MTDLMALKRRDREIAEQAIPAHMLFLMMEECYRIGLDLRADVMHKLNLASAAPLAELDTLSVARVARRVDDAARSLLRDLSPDDPRHGLYCCAMFILVLIDENFWQDRDNQAVLVAMLLMADVEDETKGSDGQGAVWRAQHEVWKKEAHKLLTRAALLGYYSKIPCN